VLWRTPRLPEAGGDPHGDAPGAGAPLRLVALGESTVAGVGAEHHGEGITACLAARLASRTARAVRWQAVGRSGATARSARAELVPRLVGVEADVLVLVLGVNDVLRFGTAAQWGTDLHALVDAAWDALGGARPTVVSPLPPLGEFGCFPQPLRAFLGLKAAAFDAVTRAVAAARGLVVAPALPPLTPEVFATDGFHPSARGYAAWADGLAAAALPLLD
jgi:lysophospholipase L1-like esterase